MRRVNDNVNLIIIYNKKFNFQILQPHNNYLINKLLHFFIYSVNYRSFMMLRQRIQF